MDSFTGLAGVGLLLTPTCPVRDLHDVTLHYASSPNLLPLYLLVRGRVDSVSSYIHVVYATVQPGLRSSFFQPFPVILRTIPMFSWEILTQFFHLARPGPLYRLHSPTSPWQSTGLDVGPVLVDSWRLNILIFKYPRVLPDILGLTTCWGINNFYSVFHDICHDFRAKWVTVSVCPLSWIFFFQVARESTVECTSWIIRLPEAQVVSTHFVVTTCSVYWSQSLVL